MQGSERASVERAGGDGRNAIHETARRVRAPTQAGMSRGSKRAGRRRNFEAKQIPQYPDAAALRAAEEELAASAPLVFAGEGRTLQQELGVAADGTCWQRHSGPWARLRTIRPAVRIYGSRSQRECAARSM